jgi:hypothetical protein
MTSRACRASPPSGRSTSSATATPGCLSVRPRAAGRGARRRPLAHRAQAMAPSTGRVRFVARPGLRRYSSGRGRLWPPPPSPRPSIPRAAPYSFRVAPIKAGKGPVTSWAGPEPCPVTYGDESAHPSFRVSQFFKTGCGRCRDLQQRGEPLSQLLPALENPLLALWAAVRHLGLLPQRRAAATLVTSEVTRQRVGSLTAGPLFLPTRVGEVAPTWRRREHGRDRSHKNPTRWRQMRGNSAKERQV